MTFHHKNMTGGKFLAAIPLSENVAIGVATLNQLGSYGLQDPAIVEAAKVRDMKHDKMLRDAHDLRGQVQRKFGADRRKNAADFARYMEGLSDGSLKGGVPPITLYCPLAGIISDEGVGITLPYNSMLVCLDGETQTHARFLRREANPESGDELLPFIIYHGVDAQHAGNVMHDLNVFGLSVKETVTAPLNSNGSVTRAVIAGINTAGVSPEKINRHGNGVLKSHLTSFNRLLSAVLGYETGNNALRKNGISAMLSRYNMGRQSIDEAAAQPLLVHLLKLSESNRDVAKAPVPVWALAGAYSKSKGTLITESEMAIAAAAFNAAKGSDRLSAAGAAIGYEVK